MNWNKFQKYQIDSKLYQDHEKMFMISKRVQNLTNKEATISQRVNGYQLKMET